MSEIMDTIQAKIDAVFESMPETPRGHIGPSQAGEPCDRRLWLGFRWAVRKNFPGRVLRLFRRGQDEEARVVSWLLAIGVDVRETGENQRRVSFGGHISGSIDGIILGGVPGASKKEHILEIKTHNKKSFEALENKGVKESKPEHWIQMQCYMSATGIDRALYVAVCKDDDRIHTERVEFDEVSAGLVIERLQRIAKTEFIPEPISADPTWYQCRFCEAHEFCHKTRQTREVNCRTCLHSTALASGKWHCARWNAEIPEDAQRDGCTSHSPHPDLVPWRLDREKSTEIAGFYEGVGLIGEGGRASAECLL